MSSLARRLTDVGPEGDALNVSPMTVLNWKSVDDPERHDTDEERRQWGRSPEPQERRFDRVDLAPAVSTIWVSSVTSIGWLTRIVIVPKPPSIISTALDSTSTVSPSGEPPLTFPVSLYAAWASP